MMILKPLPIIALALSRAVAVSATEVGYFTAGNCADSTGFQACYEEAESSFANCVNQNCDGVDASCRENQSCTGQSLDCINACACAQSIDYIDCSATSCWNQVFSCEYQLTVSDLLTNCLDPDYTDLPFWPPRDNAPGGCSCNIGKIQVSQAVQIAQMDVCPNNSTNLSQLTSNDELVAYGKACICCGESGILSAIWDICPTTKPSLLGADDYYDSIHRNYGWDECTPYLEEFDCGTTLGYASPAGNVTNFYEPGKLPENGTETLFNTAGAITSPISGESFTWTWKNVIHSITVASVDAIVTSAATGGSSGSASSMAGTAASTTGSKAGAATSISTASAASKQLVAHVSKLVFILGVPIVLDVI